MPRSGRVLRSRRIVLAAKAVFGAKTILAAGALSAAAALGACGPRSIPERLLELPPDFKRVPYMQNLSDSAATVVWQTHTPETSSLAYWTGDSVNKFDVTVDTVSIDHAITLSDLQSDTEYGYEVSTWEGRFTDARTFRTAPDPGTRKAFKFLVFGDSGEGTQGQLLLADRMPGENAALAIHVGDVAYDNGSDVDFDFRHFAVYKELMDEVPFFPSMGNHDVRTELGRPYLDAFRLPANNPDGTERYYSFQYDNVFFVALDSNTGPTYAERFGDIRDAGGEQHRWLRDQLGRARADPTVDWIVAYFHHPPYSSGRGVGGHGSDLAIRAALQPLFDEYAVDLVLSGHDHDYERSLPIRCEPGATSSQACVVAQEDPGRVRQGTGTVYVVTGSGGGPLAWRAVGVSWWTAFSRQLYQYVTVEVESDALVLKCLDTAGTVVDEIRIERSQTDAESAP